MDSAAAGNEVDIKKEPVSSLEEPHRRAPQLMPNLTAFTSPPIPATALGAAAAGWPQHSNNLTSPVTLANLAPSPQGQHDPTLVIIADRKVKIPQHNNNDQPPPSLYSLCRQWINNDPTLVTLPPPPFPDAPSLPPLKDTTTTTTNGGGKHMKDAMQPPVEPPFVTPPSDDGSAEEMMQVDGREDTNNDDKQNPPVDALLQHHVTHWKSVRQYDKKKAASEVPRFADRLQRALKEAQKRNKK